MNDVEVAWLAGLLEGEASFMLFPRGACITLRMTDEDVVRRAWNITGVGHMSDKYVPANARWKPSWRWDVHKRKDVEEVCLAIRPLMGERRGAKIDEVLAGIAALREAAEERARNFKGHGTVALYRRGCRCGECQTANRDKATDYWRRRMAAGRPRASRAKARRAA